MRRAGRTPRSPRVRTFPSPAPARASSRPDAAPRRPKAKPRLKIGAATASALPAVVRTARPAAKKAIRLAQGTVKAAPAAGPQTAVVHAVDIRPAGTVVSRRNLTKRPAILHLPHQQAPVFTPPAWMLEECLVAPARVGDQR